MEKIEKTDMIEKKDKFTIGNLDLYYGDFHALKGINLNIQAQMRSLRLSAQRLRQIPRC